MTSDRPLRIVFLTWRDLGHPDGGGSEVFVESVARELALQGHEVTVRCARYRGARAEEMVDGVRMVRRGGRLSVYPLAWLWTLVRGRHHDVVVDVVNGLPFMIPLLRRRGLVALLHHVHREQWHIIYPDWRGRLGWWIEGRLTPRLYRHVPFITVSEHTRDDLATLGIDPGHVVVAHNGLTPRPLAPGSHDARRISVLARLVPHKQIDHAFGVLRDLSDTHPDLVLDVIGEGWWRETLEQQALEMGVADRVVLHGWVSADRRDELLANSAVMLVPSVKEGWCLAIMEAAAQGTPSIAYRSAGGVNESIVDGVTGLLVDDRADLAARTAELLDCTARREHMGEHARRRAHEFTWRAAAHSVEEQLRWAISRRR